MYEAGEIVHYAISGRIWRKMRCHKGSHAWHDAGCDALYQYKYDGT